MFSRLRSTFGLALIYFWLLANVSSHEQPNTKEHFDVELAELSEQQSVEMWPFDKHNKTHEDNSCSTHMDCEACSTSSSFCHWCSHDNACHSKGSIHGCFTGVTCVPKPDKENSTCYAHNTCSDCSVASSLCHWCAHDNSCHAVGSVFGCLTGVDCYSNDNCQRDEPEEITGIFIQDVGMAPLMIIFAMGIICCCCASLCYCGAMGFKGAYDDIVVVAAGDPEGSMYGGSVYGGPSVGYARRPDVISTPTIQEHEHEDEADEQSGDPDDQSPDGDAENDEEIPNEPNITEEAALLESHMEDQDVSDSYSLMTGNVSVQPTVYDTVRERGGSNSMNKIFNLCRLCYVATLLGVVAFVALSIRCFPKTPTYNVCNDNMAWKSLVDSMTSFKAEANFEILISVLNPNHFGVNVDMGRGTFHHNSVFVGTFDIPPTKVPPMSIIDVRVIAHFTPATWEAMSLSAEYYKGTLAFDIDAKASFRFPWLFDYSMTASFNDIHVLVNDPLLKDRHLCTCPTWEEAKNKTIAIF